MAAMAAAVRSGVPSHGAPRGTRARGTWRASVEKVVNKSCSDEKIYDAIEGYDKSTAGSKCFENCPSRRWHPSQHPPDGRVWRSRGHLTHHATGDANRHLLRQRAR